jgi:PleD family two-component response regulator
MDRDGLLERADAALYAAKGAGKDRTSLAAVGA